MRLSISVIKPELTFCTHVVACVSVGVLTLVNPGSLPKSMKLGIIKFLTPLPDSSLKKSLYDVNT